MQLLSNVELTQYPNSLALSPSAAKIYFVLRQVAQRVKEHRQYHKNTSQVTFFCPLEVVALVAGVSRRTLYYKLPELRSKGLVDQKGHYCSLGSQTRLDGSLWAVKLSENMPGKAKVDFDYLKKNYRNLGQDIVEGKTAWKLLHSHSREENIGDIELILSYAISPAIAESINNDCARGSLEELLDIPFVPIEGRNAAVDRTAHTISRELGSTGNIRFWQWLIWNLIRLDQMDKNRFYQVFLYLQRARDEKRDGACSNPSGLAVSRLKNSFIWDELRSVPPIRVGRKPRIVKA